ncbi:hypothetical protein BDV36DRAFT_261370 [Aspergillus pseudocaelatus]|uniref:Uncharacterized protein n=1 Tax=Aspergillus pseudocaelatus TaxID=1825620 RepID=A0ABQ6WG06_9EURO|nr:hypothetical protein BDV36DRAFT_261370 [Aspergillus pseudocaelatus]
MISACHPYRNKRGRPGFDSQSGRFLFSFYLLSLLGTHFYFSRHYWNQPTFSVQPDLILTLTLSKIATLS